MKYDVILIEDKLKDLFPNNPFSLKNDLKKNRNRIKRENHTRGCISNCNGI